MTYLDVVAKDIWSEVPKDALPDEDAADLFLIYAVLLLAKGQDVTQEDVHNAWVAWMSGRRAGHETMIPYGDLPPDAQSEDSPFVTAIRVVARRLQTP